MPKLTDQARRNAKIKRLLSRPTLPREMAKAVKEVAVAPSAMSVSDVLAELASYRGPNAAYRKSNRYYYQALGKVYEIWLRISGWDEDARKMLLFELDTANRAEAGGRGTSRGGDLHVLLRYLIHHNGDVKEEQRLRSRDAGALRQAARLKWSAERFVQQAKDGAVGLDRLHRADIKARRSEKKVEVFEESEAPVVCEVDLRDAHFENGADFLDGTSRGARIVWKGLGKEELLGAVKGAHDVVILGRLDPHGQKIILRRAYLTGYGTHTSAQLKELVRTMLDAGLTKARRVGRRLKS